MKHYQNIFSCLVECGYCCPIETLVFFLLYNGQASYCINGFFKNAKFQILMLKISLSNLAKYLYFPRKKDFSVVFCVYKFFLQTNKKYFCTTWMKSLTNFSRGLYLLHHCRGNLSHLLAF